MFIRFLVQFMLPILPNAINCGLNKELAIYHFVFILLVLGFQTLKKIVVPTNIVTQQSTTPKSESGKNITYKIILIKLLNRKDR